MGKITHIAIHIPLPKNAIIRSKSGNTIAISTGTAIVAIRMSARYSPRRKMGGEEGERDVGARPRRISRVVEIGRVLRGILVIGIIATMETMR